MKLGKGGQLSKRRKLGLGVVVATGQICIFVSLVLGNPFVC